MGRRCIRSPAWKREYEMDKIEVRKAPRNEPESGLTVRVARHGGAVTVIGSGRDIESVI